jgi:molybdopterin-containing oxidoreductase family molybdopterin binding subunit
MKEDLWLTSACSICYSHCSIKVHRIDGAVVKIEGNPESPTTNGRVCPRGLSGIKLLYDPNRVNVPLRRTNPEKGLDIDPKWEEISWDEALDLIANKLKRIREEDPRKLLLTRSVATMGTHRLATMFTTAFGSPNIWASGAGTHCGNGEHLMGALFHASWAKQPDTKHINYYLNFGCPSGFGAYYSVTAMAQRMAEARTQGMRHVVIDPFLSPTAEKADEWIPIIPGTDAALALAMINLLLNELEICDRESIKHHTNGPYLVGPDGLYLRDEKSGKPLTWDPIENKSKVFDDFSIKDFALEGEYKVNGVTCHPAFLLLKEHVKKYTPEIVSEITTVPVATIRKLAREFGEAARVGSTILVDGHALPYRPVGVGYFRGAQGHRHSFLTCMALELLLEVVGAANVPGGMLGMSSRALGSPFSGRPHYTPEEGPDGLLITGEWATPWLRPYPFREVKKPEWISMQELIPTACVTSPLIPLVMLEPEKYKVPYKVGFHLQAGSNFLMTMADPNLIARAFKDVFTVCFNIYLDESTDLADIVLPDACYLERLDIIPDWMADIDLLDHWAYHIRQPVVPPSHQRRPAAEVLLELADRVGILEDMYAVMNVSLGLHKPYTLDPAGKYTWEEIVDRQYKSTFGPEHGLEWFKKNGVLSWPKKVEEVYWRPFIKARVPIYFEFLNKLGEDIEKVKDEFQIPGFDTSDFQPLPDWKPCKSHEDENDDHDLFAIYYRVPLHTFSFTYNNPWLDEASRMDPHVYNISINTETAKRKGIKDGDWIDVESATTKEKVRARAKVTEGIHPKVIAVANCGGHWAKNLPIASQPGKGVCFEWLMALDFDHIDTVTLNQDLCVKVKVAKAMPAES